MVKINQLHLERNGSFLVTKLSFQMGAGSLLLLEGANGSGKTTFLRALSGLFPFEMGAVELAEPAPLFLSTHLGSFSAMSIAQWAKWQRLILPVELRKEGGAKALEKMGLSPFQEREVSYLSDGLRKRLHLTRLLFQKTSLWLLDEPTEFLDGEAISIFLGLLKEHIASGGRGIIASHQPALFSGFNPKIIRLPFAALPQGKDA